MSCGLQFLESEFTSEDDQGNDQCPACCEIEFEEIEMENTNTLEKIIEQYGITRGLAVYFTVQAAKYFKQTKENTEQLENMIYDILVDYIDE